MEGIVETVMFYDFGNVVSLFLCQNFSIDFFNFGESNYIILLPNPSCIPPFLLISVKHSLGFFPISTFHNISSSLFLSQMLPILPSSGDVDWYFILRPEASTWLLIQRVKEPNGRSSGSMLGTLNPRFQKGLLAPPKSKKAGRVKDLVASKLKAFFELSPLSRTKELLEIMWSSLLLVDESNLSSSESILPLDMKAHKTPLGCLQNQWLSLK